VSGSDDEGKPLEFVQLNVSGLPCQAHGMGLTDVRGWFWDVLGAGGWAENT